MTDNVVSLSGGPVEGGECRSYEVLMPSGSEMLDAENFMVADGCLAFFVDDEAFRVFAPGCWIEVIRIDPAGTS